MPNGKKKGQNGQHDFLLNFILVLGIIGIFLSLYLFKDHYNTQKSICDFGKRISCSIINKSSYSKILSVPVAIYGVTWMSVLVAFTWKIKTAENADVVYFITAHFIWSISGLLFCLYLIYAEIMLGAICPLCTGVHIICFLESYLAWRIFKQQKVFPNFMVS